MKNGAIVFNKFYSDSGSEYVKERLEKEFFKRGVKLDNLRACVSFEDKREQFCGYSFALFFDKDLHLAEFLERNGVRVINSSKTIETCDEKIKTYSAVAEYNVKFPKTFCAPLLYPVNKYSDDGTLSYIAGELKFPIVVKENVGSLGEQVYLAENYEQLTVLAEKLARIPHHYQQFVGKAKGEDLRVYIIGEKAVAAAKRKNTTNFRSNVSLGGKIEVVTLSQKLKKNAEKIARLLKLEYGTVDFIEENGELYFIEANSNAYFKAIEKAGEDIAGKLADYVLQVV